MQLSRDSSKRTIDELVESFCDGTETARLREIEVDPVFLPQAIRDAIAVLSTTKPRLSSGVERLAVALCLIEGILQPNLDPLAIHLRVTQDLQLSKVQRSHVKGGYLGILNSDWACRENSLEHRCQAALQKAATTNQRSYYSDGKPKPAAKDVNGSRLTTNQIRHDLIKCFAMLKSRASSGDKLAEQTLRHLRRELK